MPFTLLVSTVKVRSGLFEIDQIKYLRQSIQKLSLSSVWRSIYEHRVGLGGWVQNQMLTDIPNKWSMFGLFKYPKHLFDRILVITQFVHIDLEVFSDVWVFHRFLEVLI